MTRKAPALLAGVMLTMIAGCGGGTERAASAGDVSKDATDIRPAPARLGPSPEPPEADPSATPRCLGTALRGELRPGHPGAGNRYATLVVTNQGGTCRLYGYGGLELIGADGRPLPTDLRRTLEPEPQPVTLAPGASAGKKLHWGVVPGPGEPATDPCQPTADHIEVIPPNGTNRFDVPWPFGPVCQHGHIEGSAYFPEP